jgi:acyl homoserine lactone synthase
MIVITDGYGPPMLLDAMFRHRKRVFVDQLGWAPASGDQERDRFDDLNPMYVIETDSAGDYRGSVRLLPTTGPNMLRDVFHELTPDGAPADPTIWEMSRLCTGRQGALRELIAGLDEFGSAAGLRSYVGVFDADIRAMVRHVAVDFEDIGVSLVLAGIEVFAARFPVPPTLSGVKALRSRLGFKRTFIRAMEFA